MAQHQTRTYSRKARVCGDSSPRFCALHDALTETWQFNSFQIDLSQADSEGGCRPAFFVIAAVCQSSVDAASLRLKSWPVSREIGTPIISNSTLPPSSCFAVSRRQVVVCSLGRNEKVLQNISDQNDLCQDDFDTFRQLPFRKKRGDIIRGPSRIVIGETIPAQVKTRLL